jgi:low affinity Fe/Cu permease
MAQACARHAGRPGALMAAIILVAAWVVTGPVFGFSDTWQLVINSLTSAVTFVMVFLIQSAQNRDTAAIQLKLDELIRATHGATNDLMALERESEETLEQVQAELARRRAEGDCEEPPPRARE